VEQSHYETRTERGTTRPIKRRKNREKLHAHVQTTKVDKRTRKRKRKKGAFFLGGSGSVLARPGGGGGKVQKAPPNKKKSRPKNAIRNKQFPRALGGGGGKDKKATGE